ncbi:hypothetical protein BGZ82_002556 [Podila clonocystis]|nr:hypothetical protein BGZ82_002556 [Podila clonocystis]
MNLPKSTAPAKQTRSTGRREKSTEVDSDNQQIVSRDQLMKDIEAVLANGLAGTEDYLDKAHQIAVDFITRNRIPFDDWDRLSNILEDMDIDVQIRRIGAKAFCRKLRNELTTTIMDRDNRMEELLASTKKNAELQHELQAANDKTSDLEKQLQDDRKESDRKKKQAKDEKLHLEHCLEKVKERSRQDSLRTQEERASLEQRLAMANKEKDEHHRQLIMIEQRSGQAAKFEEQSASRLFECRRQLLELEFSAEVYAEVKEQELQESESEAQRLGAQLEKANREHSQCHGLVEINEDLRKQLAEIETYVESFIQERHGLRNTTQATPAVDHRRQELRQAYNMRLRQFFDNIRALPLSEDFFDRAHKLAVRFVNDKKIPFVDWVSLDAILEDMDISVQTQRFGALAYCKQLRAAHAKEVMDHNETMTELLAGAGTYMNLKREHEFSADRIKGLEQEHEASSGRIKDLERELKSAADKISDLENMHQEDREETERRTKQAEEDKLRLECCIEKVKENGRQDSIRTLEEQRRLE